MQQKNQGLSLNTWYTLSKISLEVKEAELNYYHSF